MALLLSLRHVLVPPACPRHCECFDLLCKLVGVLQTGDRACQRASALAGLVERHAVLYAEIYAETVRPQFHYLLHVAPQLLRPQVNLSCFVTERTHREIKRAAQHIFANFEESLCNQQLNRQVEALANPTRVVFRRVRLENSTEAYQWTCGHMFSQ